MSVKGCIFSIVRTSLHDGPGVRTVVYFKGCNMHCAWCHNPEGLSAKPEIILYEQRCIGCGRCLALCNQHQIEEGKHIHLSEGCHRCGACAEVCPSSAIELCGEMMDAGQLMRTIQKDLHYYRRSNGGVTFSGGECLLQSAFLQEVCAQCREAGVHVLIETALNVPWTEIAPLIDRVGTFYVDIKHMDSDIHRKYTGMGNRAILDNLQRLSALHPHIIARIPLIPGVNDDMENLLRSCRFAAGLGKNIQGVHLLRYNPLGESKYQRMRKAYHAFASAPQDMASVQDLCARLNKELHLPGFVSCSE